MHTNLAVQPLRRLAYTFVGLIAGDLALLLFLLQNAFRSRSLLLASHMGQPAVQVPLALEMFTAYAIWSVVGWAFVGAPIALLVSATSIVRIPWPLRVVIGAVSGALALFLIFLLLARGHIDFPDGFRDTSSLWPLAVLVSAVAFPVYAALLRRFGNAENEAKM